jgi:hypothetical protein
MKILVISCLLLSLFVSACKRPLDCKPFRNGSFVVVGKTYVSEIERNGDQQLEWDNRPKTLTDPDTFKVKWLTDHSYMLLPTKSLLKRNHIAQANEITTVEIIKTRGISCTVHISTNLNSRTMEAEMIKEK